MNNSSKELGGKYKDSAKPSEGDGRTLCSLIDAAAKHRNRCALLTFQKNNSVVLDYKTLVNEIKAMASELRQQGVKNGDYFVFFAANSPAWIISSLAVIYCGGTIVPIDTQHSDEVLTHILEDSKASWIFADRGGAERLAKLMPDASHRIVRLDKEDSADSWQFGMRAKSKLTSKHDMSFDPNPPPELGESKQGSDSAIKPVDQDDIAVLFYTSGTTGMPKGVPLSHKNMILQLDALAKSNLLKTGDRILLPLPLFHVYPLNIGLLAPLSMGLSIVLPYSLTGPEIMRSLNKGKVTVVFGVPRLLRSLYESIEASFKKHKVIGAGFETLMTCCTWLDSNLGFQPGKIMFAPLRKKFGAHLRMFASGGAPLDPELAEKYRALGWEMAVGYGLSETAPLLTLRMPDDRDLAGVGKPIDGVEIKIEKTKDQSNELGEEAGEILARGANVFAGYRNRADLNKDSFCDDGWFRTGDLGLFKQGKLHVLGRASSTIVMEGGEKIQPENVEDKIAMQPGIGEIGLLQSNHKLVALIVPDPDFIGDKNAREVIANAIKTASSNFASYLRITSFALTQDPLPRTNLGKIKRFELKERFDTALGSEKPTFEKGASQQAPESNAADQSLLLEPAASSCFKWLKRRYPEQNITLDTSPQLDLNIDSLEWMNLTLELVEQTGVELSAEAVSRVTTVRQLLNEIVSSAEGGGHAVSPLDEPDHYLSDEQREFLKPLSVWQAGIAASLYQTSRLMMQLFNVRAVGAERLTAKQYVFVPNHASYIDAFALAAVLTQERLSTLQWAGWAGIAFGNPIFSFLSHFARVFPIEAKQSLFASLALGVSVLKAGSNMVWFPEGERTLDGQLLPFKKGIGLLLSKSDVLVVPVFLDGTREALPPGAALPSFHQIRVIFGEPITAMQLAKEGKGQDTAEQIANALHDRVAQLSAMPLDEIRSSTQKRMQH